LGIAGIRSKFFLKIRITFRDEAAFQGRAFSRSKTTRKGLAIIYCFNTRWDCLEAALQVVAASMLFWFSILQAISGTMRDLDFLAPCLSVASRAMSDDFILKLNDLK
jgi:hypothetical protein